MKHLLIAAALAATTASPSLLAAVYVNASLSNIQYKVIDLDLNDGIDPSVTFASINSSLNGYVHDYYSIKDSFNQYSTINDLTSATVSDSLNSASASINYSDSYATNLQASGSSLKNITDSYSSFQSQSNNYLSYTLSPNTRLELTADSNLSVETTFSDSYEVGFANNELYASNVINGIYKTEYYSYLQVNNYSNFYDPKVLSEYKSLSLFIDNVLSQESNGYLYNSSYATGATYVNSDPSAVPVPAALPLMASALGAFGIARRRNKSKAA